MLDELALEDSDQILVRYPVIEDVPEERFLLECYPLDALVGDRVVDFAPLPLAGRHSVPTYEVSLFANGKQTALHLVTAPNRWCDHPGGEACLTPTGWYRLTGEGCDEEGRLETDLEQAWKRVLDTLEKLDWSGADPLFERLTLTVEAPFYDRKLALDHHLISTSEALHEDLYFSALDLIRRRKGLPAGSRTLQPGQLAPDLHFRTDKVRVKVASTRDPVDAEIRPDLSTVADDLETADRWLPPAALSGHLDALGGTALVTTSRNGRPVEARHIEADGPVLFVSAGQHANETTGPIGALRAARRLKGQTSVVVAPMVNPDGYALFGDLCRTCPDHMNHAARYTAGGDDLEYAARGFENEIHHRVREEYGAWLHLNLHGYPAHEWVCPFSGYLPRGFEAWTLPKGFFLILRVHAGWRAAGEQVLETIARRLSQSDRLARFNADQLARYRRYAPHMPFEIRYGIPCHVSETDYGLFPVTLITEAPDETIYGEGFRLQHDAQMESVLAAAECLPDIEPVRQERVGPPDGSR